MSYHPVFLEGEFRRLTPHYRISLNGQRFLYAYIRKNACTSFKRLINRRLHPKYVIRRLTGRERHGRMHFYGNMRYFAYPKDKIPSVESFDETVFVYRDPLERFISVFANKFIHTDGAVQIRKNFESTTGIAFDKATFTDFMHYAEQDFNELNSHLWPQKAHLWEIDYTRPVDMNRLSDEMVDVVGATAADKWFGRRTNFSINESATEAVDGVLTDVSAAELRHAIDGGKQISKSNFRTKATEELVRRRYAADYEMIAEIRASR